MSEKRPFDLTGKVAFVTGAGSGIGESIAKTFARQGSAVMVADFDEKSGTRVAEEVRAAAGNAVSLKMDVTQAEQVREAVNSTVSHFGRLDILVNNAGIGFVGSLTETSEVDYDRLRSEEHTSEL